MAAMHLSIKEIICYVLVFVSLFLYIFNILPIIGPEKVGTREYLSLLASFFILIKLKEMPQIYYGLIIMNWTQVLFSVLAAILNGTSDFWYVQFAIRNILYINGAVFIAYMIPKSWTFDTLLKIVILTVLVNDIIAFIGFFIPQLTMFLVSLQDFGNMDKIERTVSFANRVVGIGKNNFYPGGVINGMSIILTFYLLGIKKIEPYIGVLLVLTMTLIGLFVARTTIVGFGLGAILYAVVSKMGKKFIASIAKAIFVILIVLFSGILDGVNTSHAFELFYNMDDIDNVESVNTMRGMYDIDISPSTFIIGDGLSKDGVFYYMHTDVGYLRNILYFGLIGTILGYFFYEWYILKVFYKCDKSHKWLILFLGLYLIVLNFKGLPDYNYFIFLFVAFYIRKRVDFKKYMRQRVYSK